MSFRVFEIKKIKKAQKRGFFQFLAVFGPPKGGFGPNFQKNIFFVITEYRMKVQVERIMNFQNFFHKVIFQMVTSRPVIGRSECNTGCLIGWTRARACVCVRSGWGMGTCKVRKCTCTVVQCTFTDVGRMQLFPTEFPDTESSHGFTSNNRHLDPYYNRCRF